MKFSQKFTLVSNILEAEYGIQIDENHYDGYIVKKLSASNCLINDSFSHQSHIAITGEQMDLFPFFYSKSFIEKNVQEMKNYFVVRAPINIFKNNCEKISSGYIDFNGQEKLKEHFCIYPRSGATQVQLSIKQNGDSVNFIKFRELINPNDFLLILKLSNKLEYDAFILKESIIRYKEELKNVFEVVRKSKDITFVDERNFFNDKNDVNISQRLEKDYQRIFFGAPGTGKSYELNKDASANFLSSNCERVTFHPNYMYGNFVGAYKPFPKKSKDNQNNEIEFISYEYVPGVLIRLLVKALINPTKNYLLIIEEINRAPVAAVFGDIFQLLDRNSEGESEYFISTSKELQEYLFNSLKDQDLTDEVRSKLGEDFSRLYLPKNLYLWATMNSADQGVLPLDTAFRRRWSFKYIGVNEAADKNAEIFEKYRFKSAEDGYVTWDNFRRKLNERLSTLNIPEDKLLGPFFISKHILDNSTPAELTEVIKDKVLMYLYEDVARSCRSLLFAEGKFGTYSELCRHFSNDVGCIFKGGLELDESQIVLDSVVSSEEQSSGRFF